MLPADQHREWADYLVVYMIGFFSQLFRLMMGPDIKTMGAVRVLSGAAGAGIASVVAVNITKNLMGDTAADYVIAISGIVGWLGGNAMTAMASTVEKRLGINLRPDPESKVSTTPAPEPVNTTDQSTPTNVQVDLPAPLDDLKGSAPEGAEGNPMPLLGNPPKRRRTKQEKP